MPDSRTRRRIAHLSTSGKTCTVERVEVRACVQRQQDPSWTFARGRITHIQGWIVTLVSTTGERGDGHVMDTPVATPDADRSIRAIHEATRALAGANAFQLERLQLALEEAVPAAPCVVAGFVAALHELAARTLGVPLHALLGQHLRDTIPVTRIVPVKTPEAMAHEATRLMHAGYRTLKLKLDGRADDDLARVRAVRRAVGRQVALTVDANQAYDADSAIEVCHALAAEEVSLMEQPVPAADHDGLKRVADTVPLVVEADEAIVSVAELVRLIAMRAAGSYNLKIHYLGGLQNTLSAIHLCEAAGVAYRLGALFAPRLASAQAAHLAAVARSVSGGAEIGEFDHLLDDPYSGFEVRCGTVPVPEGVGCGVALLRSLESA